MNRNKILTVMTLKELLNKVDFDSMVPYIEKTEGKHLDLSQYDNAAFCVRYSSQYPVSNAALAGFWKQIRDFFCYDDIRTGTIIENSDEREVKAVLLLNKM